MVLQISSPQAKPTITWETLPANFILPDEPVENIQQPSLAAAVPVGPSSSGPNPLRSSLSADAGVSSPPTWAAATPAADPAVILAAATLPAGQQPLKGHFACGQQRQGRVGHFGCGRFTLSFACGPATSSAYTCQPVPSTSVY